MITNSLIELIVIVFLIIVQSIFGVGLLLFGTPTLLILGYDFANTINILMPVSISISLMQFFRSKISDRKFKQVTLGGCVFYKKGQNLCLKIEKT